MTVGREFLYDSEILSNKIKASLTKGEGLDHFIGKKNTKGKDVIGS